MKKEKKREGVGIGKPRRAVRHARRIFFVRGAVVLLIALQFALWFLLFASGAAAIRQLNSVFTVLAFSFSLYTVSSNEASAYKLLWIFFLLLLPIPGTVSFFLLKIQRGGKRFRRKGLKRDAPPTIPTPKSGIEPLSLPYPNAFRRLCGAGFSVRRSEITYFPLGEDKLASLLRDLETAEHYIYLEYFIVAQGEILDSLHAILKKKAENGVDVRLLFDDVGSFLIDPRRFTEELRKDGIKSAVFNAFSPFITAAQNYRDHRKIAVIDGRIAYTGGINIGDEYANLYRKYGHWKDTAVRMTGEAALDATALFLSMWEFTTGEKTPMPDAPEHCGDRAENGHLCLYADAPGGDPIIKELYLSLITSATKTLYLSTPYLIPDDALFDALMMASRSGVDVRIITPAIADKKLVNVATKSYYRPLLLAGVRIYEYTPGFIHSKVILADGRVASVGSANLDFRSLYLSFETGALLTGEATADIAADFEQLFTISHEIAEADTHLPVPRRLVSAVMRLFAPLF